MRHRFLFAIAVCALAGCAASTGPTYAISAAGHAPVVVSQDEANALRRPPWYRNSSKAERDAFTQADQFCKALGRKALDFEWPNQPKAATLYIRCLLPDDEEFMKMG